MLYATHARVNLGAIRDNLQAIRTRVGSRAVLAAVKANAYGHGAVAVSRMIQVTGAADMLGVATVPEALELRDAGITRPILKLSHCFPGEVQAAVEAGIALTVVDEPTVRAASAAAVTTGRTTEVHLKIDTGMRRIGAEPAVAPRLAALIETLPGLELVGLMTHLPASDDPADDEATQAQLATFTTTVDAIHAEIGRTVPYVHAANSGAVLAHPDAYGTLVRPGIMIYGHYPGPETARTVELTPALELVTRVSFVKRVAAGDSVGYGRTWRASHETTIATIPAGYADGFSRLGSNRAYALVNGRRYQVAGRVCMDQTMLDLGDDPVTIGDEVVLIGRQGDEEITMTEVADLMGTIPYEVPCLIPARVTRVYA